jgi:predicted TIM-barrel fold metal-dependent hydrolase
MAVHADLAPPADSRTKEHIVSRLMLVSSDCHWGDSVDQYRQYMPSKHHEAFDQHVAELAAQAERFNPELMFGEMDEETKQATGTDQMDERNAFAAGVDNNVRLKELESDGVVGEVIFPNFVVPFSSSFGMQVTQHPAELQLAGMHAYNQALAEFIDPNRQVGLALISYLDIDAAVKEVQWAKEAGLRGVLVGALEPSLPLLGADPYYDPLWAACAELGMPIHFHGGAGAPPVSFTAPGGIFAFTIEAVFYGHRTLWYMIGGGTLERHPDLKMVFTELGSDWIMRGLDFMDHVWGEEPRFSILAKGVLPMKPSEYWHRQGYVGASMMSQLEMGLRHRLGVDKVMFGTDYPHGEGTWGRTTEYLQTLCTVGGATEAETRAILGENAVALYGLPQADLQAIADRVGPTVEAVLTEPDQPLADRHHLAYLNRPPFAV